jgi:hypothetical protein
LDDWRTRRRSDRDGHRPGAFDIARPLRRRWH